MGKKIIHTGIIPYYFHNNNYYLFLSEEVRDKNKWCGFTGRREDNENLINAAAREGWEESMGLLGTISELEKKIKQADYAIFSYQGNNASVQYLIKCELDTYNHLEHHFNNVTAYINHCSNCQGKEGCFEKTQGKWISLLDIMKSAALCCPLNGTNGYLRDLFDMSLMKGCLIRKPTLTMFSKYL